MARSSTSFRKGQSGNPAGRPPKSRALTAILERSLAARRALPDADRAAAGHQLLARAVVEAVLTGRAPYQVPGEDGQEVTPTLSARDWAEFARWIYQHIDGPPKAELAVEQTGALNIVITYADPAPDDPPDPAPPARGPA